MDKNNRTHELILLGIILPEMNGYESCSQIRKDACFKDVSIIFCNKSLEFDQCWAKMQGGTNFLAKSYTTE
ncbi:response regulator [Enterovibrio nigricans]|nr:response regulator [Enterovibrio nigricans]